MNKILVNNDEVSLISTDEKINVTLSDKFDIYDIVKLRIEVLEDTNIDIEYQSDKEVKMDIVIEVKEKSKSLDIIKSALASQNHVPGFVEVDADKMVGKLLRLPERSELNQEINESLIVEYYNRLG